MINFCFVCIDIYSMGVYNPNILGGSIKEEWYGRKRVLYVLQRRKENNAYRCTEKSFA